MLSESLKGVIAQTLLPKKGGGRVAALEVLIVTPAISNLNGDSVAWAGVGSTVVLDASANASLTDTELGALNAGNGNWNGASLTVQRNGTAVPEDIFGFDTTGASFEVDGSNQQTGGQTIATFTNTNGGMTLTFNGSGTFASA